MLFEQLHAASFNNIGFLVKKATTTGGRKVVSHEYVRSDRRFVEDLGLDNRIFKIKGVITGEDYLIKRENLLRQLELPGQGILLHPLYGRVTVTALPYSIDEDLQKTGMAIITMTFQESVAQSQPLPETFPSNALAQQNSSVLNGFVKNGYVTRFQIPENVFGNFADAINQNINVGDFFRSALSAQGPVGNTSEFERALKDFDDNTVTFVTNPSSFTNSSEDLFNQIQTLFDTPEDSFQFLSTGFVFNSVGINLESETPSNRQRENNRKATVDFTRIMSLSAAYNQAAQITFQLQDDLLDTKEQLDTAFNDIVNENRAENNSLDQLEALRDTVNKIFNQQSVNLFRIETINVQTQPVALIAFNHYGDTDLEEELVSLNMTFNPSFVAGDFSILTR